MTISGDADLAPDEKEGDIALDSMRAAVDLNGVRTEKAAALAGKRDNLVGLKENVILGHLVPTGTGFREYQKTRVQENFDLHAAA